MTQPDSKSTPLVPERRRMKCQSGIPLIHNEKKQPRSLALTDTAMRCAKDFSDFCGTSSISESVETALRLVSQLKVHFQLEELKLMVQNLPTGSDLEESEVNPQ